MEGGREEGGEGAVEGMVERATGGAERRERARAAAGSTTNSSTLWLLLADMSVSAGGERAQTDDGGVGKRK